MPDYPRRFRNEARAAMKPPIIARTAPRTSQIVATSGTDRKCSANPSRRHNPPSAAIVIPIPMRASDEIDEMRGFELFMADRIRK
jgi:hypothetical protein